MPVGGLAIDELSRVGFGCYRVDIRDPINRVALELALASGCNLIDTASNYSDGRAEELVGSVLASTGAPAFIVTKVGYITPSAARWLESKGQNTHDLPDLSEHSKYSIDAELIPLLLELSRARLGRDVLDVVLLHNPEHLSALGLSDEEAGTKILQALAALQAEIDAGRLRYFGVSSNVMATTEPGTACDFEAVIARAPAGRGIEQSMFIEFPLNLLERSAATADGRPSLLSRSAGRARRIANRPLNAQRDGDVARLATSAPPAVLAVWNECIALVERRLAQAGEPHNWSDFRPMQFLRDNLSGIGDFDLIDAIWRAQVEPFIQTLFGPEPSAEVRNAFHDMRHAVGLPRRQNIERRGMDAVRDLVDSGLLELRPAETLAQAACRYVLEAGVDHVVVGMRNPRYVEELAPYFRGQTEG
jgi:aryl-alcohol dehydrogenase-like predicted oxidoreductase